MEEFSTENPIIAEEKPSNSKKKLIIIIVICVTLALIITGLLLFFLVFKKKEESNDSPFNKNIRDDLEIDLIPKTGKYDYVLIFMHGLFGNSSNFLEQFDKKDGPVPGNFKIIFPCAPEAYVSRCKTTTNSWFDITGEDMQPIYEKNIVYADMNKNADRIKKIINEEAKILNNSYSKIFVGGFSQGACMSFHIGLSFDKTLGGIIPFCGIPVSKTKIKEGRKNLPILPILGTKDIFFLFNYSEPLIRNTLMNFTNVNITKLEIEHAVTNDGLEKLKIFIKSLTQNENN